MKSAGRREGSADRGSVDLQPRGVDGINPVRPIVPRQRPDLDVVNLMEPGWDPQIRIDRSATISGGGAAIKFKIP